MKRKYEDYPDYEIQRRTVTIDAPIDEYLQRNVNNVSGTINRILWDALGGEIPEDGPEYETPNVQRRVFKIQLEAMKKERHYLEKLEEDLQAALDDIEEQDGIEWETRLSNILRAEGKPGWDKYEPLDESDPDIEE